MGFAEGPPSRQSALQDSTKGAAGNRLSEELMGLAGLARYRRSTYGDLFARLSSRSHAVSAILLAAPFLLPVPIPGLSVLFGLALALVGLAMALGRPPWFPRWWRDRRLPHRLLHRLFRLAAVIVRKCERLFRPRGVFFSTHPWLLRVVGLTLVVCGGLLALPLPPGTNLPPAITVLLLAIAVLERDTLMLLLGYVAFGLTLGFFGGMALLGWHGIRSLAWAETAPAPTKTVLVLGDSLTEGYGIDPEVGAAVATVVDRRFGGELTPTPSCSRTSGARQWPPPSQLSPVASWSVY